MLEDKRWKFTWVGIILLGVMLLGIPAVYAGDMEPNPADVAAAEAQKAYEQLLGDIEASRFTVVDDLVDRFATDKETAEELRATLDSANATKLAEIVQKANSLDDIATILTGKTQEELTKEILALGDLDKDYVFTPVRPCRIVDTRIGGGGVFFPGQVREFFVYGDTTAQGGANCPSPRGEPRGVHINVTAVPQSGQGNFRAYPANVSAPNASLVNYKAGVQNIANAASVKTHFQLGTGGLKIQNRVGTSHLVVDILGYYHESDTVPGVDWSLRLGNNIYITSQTPLHPTLLTSQTIDCPGVGTQYVVATGSAFFFITSMLTYPSDIAWVRTSLSATSSWDWNAEGYHGARQNVTTDNEFIGGGTISKTHVFTCTGGASLTVRFFAYRGHGGPSTRANHVSLVLTVYPKRY